MEYKDLPEGMEVKELILERTLANNDALLEICVVKHGRQYEAAVFVDKKYRPGPPLPRPLETPTSQWSHWMGVRPKIGLSSEESEKVLYEVNGVNALYRIQMKDTWGQPAL